jgi:UDP-N-acetylglucosamine 2-epimerase (non-hydrolysing)
VGARPNFIKIAPLMQEMTRQGDRFTQLLVHTGQHYDPGMSDIFFEELELPRPDVNLEVGSGTHAWQTGQVMIHFEPILLKFKPDVVFVVGDVNSTLACALVAVKTGFPLAHVEAGLRSHDRSMPEEINRLLTDQIAWMLFTPSEEANENLLREGIQPERIFFVGNIMIDTLVRLQPKALSRWAGLQQKYRVDEYILVTLHRPSNVDDPVVLGEILAALDEISLDLEVIFPLHPRTRNAMERFGLSPSSSRVRLIDPLGYLDFLAMQSHARLVITDSGGVQEETTFLGVPCLTVRPNTERPVTIKLGTNRLVENRTGPLIAAIRSRLEEKPGTPQIPPLWDGRTAQRIVQSLSHL